MLIRMLIYLGVAPTCALDVWSRNAIHWVQLLVTWVLLHCSVALSRWVCLTDRRTDGHRASYDQIGCFRTDIANKDCLLDGNCGTTAIAVMWTTLTIHRRIIHHKRSTQPAAIRSKPHGMIQSNSALHFLMSYIFPQFTSIHRVMCQLRGKYCCLYCSKG